MRAVVAVKQVPDTSVAAMGADGSIVRTGVPSVLDPYCENALRRIVACRREGDTIDVVSMGPPQAEATLRRCIAIGADRAFLLTDPDFAGADTWATSRTLAAFLQRHEADADLLVFGRQTLDGDTGQVPAEVAGILGVQQFLYTRSLEAGDPMVAVQDYGSFIRRTEVPRGSVVSFGDVDPCGFLPSVPDLLRARRADVVRMGRIDVQLGLYSVGLKGSATRILGTRSSDGARRNMRVEITNPDIAADLIIKEGRSLS